MFAESSIVCCVVCAHGGGYVEARGGRGALLGLPLHPERGW